MKRIALCTEATYLSLDRPVDGDTIAVTVLLAMQTRDKLRLMEVDAPERGQGNYNEARRELLILMDHGPLRVELVHNDARDRCGCNRLLGWVWSGSLLVNAELLRSGWAIHLPKFGTSLYTPQLLDAQREAQDARRGRWASRSQNAPPPHLLGVDPPGS